MEYGTCFKKGYMCAQCIRISSDTIIITNQIKQNFSARQIMSLLYVLSEIEFMHRGSIIYGESFIVSPDDVTIKLSKHNYQMNRKRVPLFLALWTNCYRQADHEIPRKVCSVDIFSDPSITSHAAFINYLEMYFAIIQGFTIERFKEECNEIKVRYI